MCARYDIALAKAQAQDFDAALADWTALAAESQSGAPWMPLLRRDIVNMARFLKRDLTQYLPDATAAEITKAGGAVVAADSTARIGELRAALAEDAHDYKASIELAQLLARSGENRAAAAVIAQARESYAAAPFVLQKLGDASRALGLDMIAQAPGVSGPTAEDIAAAADMSEQEQSEMIDGIVAGLAAKLEENPGNPDGWIMLVRSDVTLGQDAKARSYFNRATALFEGNDAVLARLSQEAGSVLKSE